MSTGLFKSKQFKSKKNLKGLLISPPVLANSTSAMLTQSSPLKQMVVLRAIYDFEAESEIETSIKKGDYLKLLDKPGDGWLYVQVLDQQYDHRGLVPASYVDIEVNDNASPVTKDWLCETRTNTPLAETTPTTPAQKLQFFTSGNSAAGSTPTVVSTSPSTPRSTTTPNILNPSTYSPKQDSQKQFLNYNLANSKRVSTSSSTESSPRQLNQRPKKIHQKLPEPGHDIVTGSSLPLPALPPLPTITKPLKPKAKSDLSQGGLTIDTNSPFVVEDDFNFFQRSDSLPQPSPISKAFKIRTVSITNVLQYDNRFYYRIDVTLENKSKRYIMKTYQDFYNLHINLSILNINEKTLPKLPQPIRQQTKSSLLIRCNELNVYLNKLVRNEFFKNCEELFQWITNKSRDEEKQKIIDAMSNVDDDFINELLLPNSIDMISQNSSNKSKYSTTAPLPPSVPNSAFELALLLPIRSTSSNQNNMKYSSYMNQTQRKNSMSSSLNTPRKPFPHLNSSNTLELYSSLIDRYDASESITNQSITCSLDHLARQLTDTTQPKTSQAATTSVNVTADEITDSAAKKHSSSSSDSDSLFSESKDNSPTTPAMEHGPEFERKLSASPITPGTSPTKKDAVANLIHKRVSSEPIQFNGSLAPRLMSVNQTLPLPISPTRIKLSEFVKVKVVLNNQEDDIIVLKVMKKELHHINDLKKIVSEKIYKDANLINHYTFELGNITDQFEIMQCLLQSNKVNLKLMRLRQ